MASTPGPQYGDVLTYTIRLRNAGGPITTTLSLTDPIPSSLAYVPGSAVSTLGTPIYDQGTIGWSDVISTVPEVVLTYAVTVTAEQVEAISNTVVIDASPLDVFARTATVIANADHAFFPLIMRQSR
jgi:uncharacterized repeat protein (TIGR01451 family)